MLSCPMRVTAVFHYGRPSVALAPESIRVVGDFADVAEARQVAIDTATKNRFFAEWCVGFDLEDAEGNILWQWDKNDRRTT
jgi:hypothetical protein